MKTASQKYVDMKVKIAEAKKAMEKVAKNAFNEITEEFFDANPDIQSFGWTQYTPYFNDGDECVFSAHVDYPTVTFISESGKIIKFNDNYCEMTDSNGDEVNYDLYEKEAKKQAKEVSKFFKPFDQADLKTLFGDHIEVIVTRKGVTTEDYEHD
jgi:hypothetical protein